MRSSARRFLRKLINASLNSVGFELVRKGWVPERLRKQFEIQTLIDVGVGVGRGTPELYKAFPAAKLLLVDPNPISWPHMDSILKERAGFAAKVGAGSKLGSIEFKSYPNAPGVSSFLRREAHKDFDVEVIMSCVKPLDAIVKSSGLEGPFGIKIDTEGYELEVLLGADETLQNCEFVLFESQIESLDPRPYSQAEIFTVLETAGFHLYDIIWVAYEHATLKSNQADFLFRRDKQFKRI